jgi:predicted dehydrogenase
MTANLALVGCAHIHTPGFVKTLQQRDDVTVTAVWDHQPDRAAAYAAQFGCPTRALDAILADPAIQAVVVCTETDRHETVVLPAAAAGKALFVEKPLGFGADDALAMADAITRAGVIFQTGYFMRGYPVHQFVKAQLAAGAFGRVTRVRHTNCHCGSLQGWFDGDYRWMADPAVAGCGAFGDLGTHVLDILMWLFGDVTAATAIIDTAIARYPGCDEYGEGLLRFAHGVAGTLAAGWVDVDNPITLQINGTEGWAYVRNGELFFKSAHVDGADGRAPWTDLPAPWPHAFEIFLNTVLGDTSRPTVTPREAAARSCAMAAMYEGSATREWVVPKG